jgi:hypothetical protein
MKRAVESHLRVHVEIKIQILFQVERSRDRSISLDARADKIPNTIINYKSICVGL